MHMAANDYSALLEASERLGDASRGGDPQLWTDVLEFLGSQSWDCSAQVPATGLWMAPVLPCAAGSKSQLGYSFVEDAGMSAETALAATPLPRQMHALGADCVAVG